MTEKDVSAEARVNLLRLISVFLVIMAHVDLGNEPGAVKVFYYNITRMGAPLFFMCLGYLLLSKQEPLLQFLKTHFVSLLIVFFFWSAAYDFLGNNFYRDNFTLVQLVKVFLHILKSATVGYYWLFYSLIGIYLFVPVLWVFLPKEPTKEIVFYLCLWVVGFSLMPFVRSAIRMDYYGLEPYFLQRYVGYFVLGYYLAKFKEREKIPWIMFSIFIICFIFSYCVFYFNLPPTNNEDFFRSYMSLNIVLMTCSFYALIHWVGKYLSPRLWAPLEFIDKSTFGIYVSHLMILGFVENKIRLFDLQNSIFSLKIIVAFTIFLISFAIVTLLRKTPVVKYLVPQIGK